MVNDTTKLWHLVECLNEENRFQCSVLIEDKGHSNTETQAASVHDKVDKNQDSRQ